MGKNAFQKAKSEMTLKDKCAFIKTSTGHFHLVCSPSSPGQGSIRRDLMMGERPGQLSRFWHPSHRPIVSRASAWSPDCHSRPSWAWHTAHPWHSGAPLIPSGGENGIKTLNSIHRKVLFQLQLGDFTEWHPYGDSGEEKLSILVRAWSRSSRGGFTSLCHRW